MNRDTIDSVIRSLRRVNLQGSFFGQTVAIRFGLSKPGVSTVLVGYSTLAHLEEAIRFTERGPLSADAIARVLSASG